MNTEKQYKSVIFRWLAKKLLPYIEKEGNFLIGFIPEKPNFLAYGFMFMDDDRIDIKRLKALLHHVEPQIDTIQKLCQERRTRDLQIKRDLAAKMSPEEIAATDLEDYLPRNSDD